MRTGLHQPTAKTLRHILSRPKRLDEFLATILPLMGRRERQHWGAFYVRGLLLDRRRRTALGMAERLGGDDQGIQQFLSQSPWDWVPVRQALAQKLAPVVTPRTAWVLDELNWLNRGLKMVGVVQQNCPDPNRMQKCQIAVALSYASDQGTFPVDFELYLPEEWLSDTVQRRKAYIPETLIFKPKWELALNVIDRVREWGLPPSVIIAGPELGMVPEFRAALRTRKLPYLVGIHHQLTVQRASGQTEFRKQGHPESVLGLAERLPDDAWSLHPQDKGGTAKSRFATVPVQPIPGKGYALNPTSSVEQLLVKWPLVSLPTDFWLSNLPADTPLDEMVYWTEAQHSTAASLQQMTDDLGLEHYEGRSWLGWHHHVTLVMIAFGYLVNEMFELDQTIDTQSTMAQWAKLPADLKQEVSEYIQFQIQKHEKRAKKARFGFDWEDGLVELGERYSSVALQRKARGTEYVPR